MRSKDKKTTPKEFRDRILKAVENDQPLVALDSAGRFVKADPNNKLDENVALGLVKVVGIVAGFCPKCYGSKKEDCSNCDRGVESLQMPCPQCVAGMMKCPKCHGGQWLECDNCKGTTKVTVTNYVSRGATRELRSRLVDCDKCRNWWNIRRGFVECDDCKNGEIPCTKCKKKGTVPVKRICPVCEKGKVACAGCQGTGRRNP